MLRGSFATRSRITGRLNTTLSFWIITLVYVIIGLMEVDDTEPKSTRIPPS